MPDLASTLKAEIRRLARREVRTEVVVARRLVAQHRRDIAKLKRLLGRQERTLGDLRRVMSNGVLSNGHGSAPVAANSDAVERVRFSARAMRAQRERLHLTREQYGKLLGVTYKAVYYWESGKTRPRPQQLQTILALRNASRADIQARLGAEAPKRRRRRKPKRK